MHAAVRGATRPALARRLLAGPCCHSCRPLCCRPQRLAADAQHGRRRGLSAAAGTAGTHLSTREITEQLQRAEGRKAAAFSENDFAALPAIQEELDRLAAMLAEAEGSTAAEEKARAEQEMGQAERLSQLRADAAKASSGVTAAVSSKLYAAAHALWI